MSADSDPTLSPEPATPSALEKRRRRMLMTDIARAAGVSTSTVSRALSGNPLIKAATRERIAELARSMNYQINIGAANLRKRDLRTVGLVILGDSMQSISDPFILSLVGHIADELDERNLNMLLSRVTQHRQHLLAQLVESGQVLGLLVIGQMNNHQQLNEIAERGTPMVVWGGLLPDTRYNVVGGDNENGGYLATRHLLDKGCRRIAFLGDRASPEVHLRYEGYRRALAERGLEPDAQLYKPVLYQDTALREVINEWLQQHVEFDGVFATSDVAALSIIAALSSKGLQVPSDVRVVGYDDIALSAYVHPSVSSVRQPTDLAAKAMVRMLLEQAIPADQAAHELAEISQQYTAPPAHAVKLDALLIARDSSL